MCKSDMGLFVRIRQDFCDFDWRVCDCVGLGRRLESGRNLMELREGQHGWRATPDLLRFWGRVEKTWVNLRLVEIK